MGLPDRWMPLSVREALKRLEHADAERVEDFIAEGNRLLLEARAENTKLRAAASEVAEKAYGEDGVSVGVIGHYYVDDRHIENLRAALGTNVAVAVVHENEFDVSQSKIELECPRCGAPFAPAGYCSRRPEGCQG